MVLSFQASYNIIMVQMMQFRDDYEQTIRKILKECPRGLGTILKFQHPEILKYIFEMTKFLDALPRGATLATRLWYLFEKRTEIARCKIDGKPILKNVYKLSDPRLTYCCPSCAQRDPEVREKCENTCLKNYGCKCGWNSRAEDGELKRSKTFKKLMQDPRYKSDFLRHQKETSKKNYDAECWTQTEEGRKSCSANGKDPQRVAKTARSRKIARYGKLLQDPDVIPLFSLEEYVQLDKRRISQTEFKWKCKHCGVEFERKIQYYIADQGKPTQHVTSARCPWCYPRANTASLEEKKLAGWMKSICPPWLEIINNTLENYKIIKPYQLDIVARDKITHEVKLAVEYNGSRWHSLEEGKTLLAQLNKTKRCEEVRIPLVHIYEDEWLGEALKRTALKDYIKSLLFGQFSLEEMLESSGFQDTVVLSRDKFCLALAANLAHWKLAGEVEPDIVLRRSRTSGFEYHVGDCGSLVFTKL